MLVCSDALITELKNAPFDVLSFAAWSVDLMQLDAFFPNYAGTAAPLIRWPAIFAVSYRWFKSTLSRDFAQTVPQLCRDIGDGWASALAGKHDELFIYQLSRKAIGRTVARYVLRALGRGGEKKKGSKKKECACAD